MSNFNVGTAHPTKMAENDSVKQGMFKIVLHWYTKLFAVWIVLFATVGYYCPEPFVAIKNYRLFGGIVEKWPEVFQSLQSPNLWFFALTMFGIGAVLTVNDFKNIAKRPVIVLIGSLAQFTIMPLGAFLLAKLFSLSPAMTAGLVVAGCAPGAMSSNVMSYIAKADVAYSVSLTTVSTLLCPDTDTGTDKAAGSAAEIPVFVSGKCFFEIVFMVVIPLGVGLCRYGIIFTETFVEKAKGPVSRDFRDVHHLHLHAGDRQKPRPHARRADWSSLSLYCC